LTVSLEPNAIFPRVGEIMSKVNRWREFSLTKTVAASEKDDEADLSTRTDGQLAAEEIFGSDTLKDEQAILAAGSEGLPIKRN